MNKKRISTLLFAAMLSAAGTATAVSAAPLQPSKVAAIEFVAPLVLKYDEPGGMFPSVKIAQVMLETGYGTSELWLNANNPTGMKFSEPFKSQHPNDYYVKGSPEWTGSNITIIESAFRKYASLEAGIRDHSNFFYSTDYRKNTVYAPALRATNPKAQANALSGTYATDPNYGTKLIEIIEAYNLTKYDTPSGSVTVPVPENPKPPVVTNSGTYALYKAVNVYISAADAESGRNPVKTYPAGSYYIFKTYDGMINITRTPGQAGAWINPRENSAPAPVTTTTKPAPVTTTTKPAPVTTTTKPAPVTTNPQVIAVNKPVNLPYNTNVYINAYNAEHQVSAVKQYPAGTYYVYAISGNAVNITKVNGVPGAWIPRSALITASSAAPVAGSQIIINSPVAGYYTADNAIKGISSTVTYPAGSYYIYKVYNGAINISSIKGQAGAWIKY